MASVAGISILVFRVLPIVPAEHGIVIMMGCSLCPSIINVGKSFWKCKARTSCEKNNAWPIITLLSFLAQIISVIVWPILMSISLEDYDIPRGEIWAIPLSMILVSARWWENYVDLDHTNHESINDEDQGIEKAKQEQQSKEGNGTVEGKTQQQQQASKNVDKQNTRTLKDEISDSKVELHLVMSFLKIGLTIVLAAALQTTRSFTDVFHLLRNGNKCIGKLTLNEVPGMNADWAWVYMINTGSAMFVYICAANAAKIKMQKLSYALPLTISPFILFIAIYFSCQRWNNSHCFFSNWIAIPSYMFFHCHSGDHIISYVWRLFVWFMLLWASQIIITLHIWYPGPERLTQTDK